MMDGQIPVDGLPVDVGWEGIDPADWREYASSDGDEFEDDEDRPTPRDVIAVSGIDPDRDW